MTPIARIRWRYFECPRELPFAEYLEWHYQHGFVFSTPDYFIMGTAQNAADMRQYGVPLIKCLPEKQDSWYVFAMAGDMSKAWDCLPYRLPNIAFERTRAGRLELTILEIDRMKRLSRHNLNDV